MRHAIALALLTASICSSAGAVTRVPKQSWGKANVSFERYRTDALKCTAEGYLRDVSDTDAAAAFVDASKRYQDQLDGTLVDSAAKAIDASRSLAQVVQSARPEKNMRKIGALLQSTVDDCLTRLGYSRFWLTEAQRHDLARLKIGSTERRLYLHRLAADPAILRAQAAAPATTQ